jgi:hypothetical protein
MSIASPAFLFVKGEDAQIDWTVQTSATNISPIDVTGWTFAFTVKRWDRDADPAVIAPTITVPDAINGTVAVAFSAASMDLLSGTYRYSFWRTNAGSKACLARGFFTVQDSTRS